MQRFEGYRALVTGAGSGIGAAVARRLASEGAAVAVTDVDAGRAAEVAESVTAEGGTAVALRCDVSDTTSVDSAVAAATERLGGLETLVNNAFAGTPETVLLELSDMGEWLAAFDVTLHGAYRCARAAMPHLARAEGRGSIVTVGSVNGEQDFGGHAYSAAKAALGSLTRTLAVESAPRGVRANLVAPGTVDTPAWDRRRPVLERVASHYPLRRVGRPEDIAAAVAFLASRDADWVTGVTLPVDGGVLIGNVAMRRDMRDPAEDDAR
ncbi:SDR family NAD(P)-dependent oxidoreductase [Streptomyces bohaiensis]|uniref:SDR family NAD(P)-dependent oxidoreductase n=1 Tax=Streptomyces bohaiensis TaxID=1431344 RepID=UPI003B807A02